MKKEKEKITTPKSLEEDKVLDLTLRPKSWEGFIGQKRIKENLKIMIEASQRRGEPCPEHLLFYGNSGLGKTTLAHIVANQLENKIRVTSGTAVKRVGDLAAILSNLQEGEVLFIDEMHRLPRLIEEFLYPAMEDYELHLILGQGPMAKTMELSLPRFTLIGATTKVALLSTPMRNRFGAVFQLDFYREKEIARILKRSANILNVSIDKRSARKIAERARFTPRVANRLLKRVRDWAQVEADGKITPQVVEKALDFLDIDEKGLGRGDRRVLKTIIKKFDGGPVGLKSISAASAEEKAAIEEIYEPYLLRLGLLHRTSQGRVATKLAYQHLEIKRKPEQKNLIDQ